MTDLQPLLAVSGLSLLAFDKFEYRTKEIWMVVAVLSFIFSGVIFVQANLSLAEFIPLECVALCFLLDFYQTRKFSEKALLGSALLCQALMVKELPAVILTVIILDCIFCLPLKEKTLKTFLCSFLTMVPACVAMELSSENFLYVYLLLSSALLRLTFWPRGGAEKLLENFDFVKSSSVLTAFALWRIQPFVSAGLGSFAVSLIPLVGIKGKVTRFYFLIAVPLGVILVSSIQSESSEYLCYSLSFLLAVILARAHATRKSNREPVLNSGLKILAALILGGTTLAAGGGLWPAVKPWGWAFISYVPFYLLFFFVKKRGVQIFNLWDFVEKYIEGASNKESNIKITARETVSAHGPPIGEFFLFSAMEDATYWAMLLGFLGAILILSSK